MSIIMKDGKYVNTDPSEEDKKAQEEHTKEKLFELGDRFRARRKEAEKVVEEIKQERKKEKDLPKQKEKSTKILLRTQTILKKATAAWPARSDLRELVQEVNEAVTTNNFLNHTKTFVKVLTVLEEVIPAWSGEQKLQLTKLQKLIYLRNEKERKHNLPKVSPVNTITKTYLTRGDIDRWVETAKKGDRLIYYTGHTFDTKEYQEQKVFSYVRNLCFTFAPVAGTWEVKYHNIITLIQQKVVPEQKDADKNVISHAIYNYIMEKL